MQGVEFEVDAQQLEHLALEFFADHDERFLAAGEVRP